LLIDVCAQTRHRNLDLAAIRIAGRRSLQRKKGIRPDKMSKPVVEGDTLGMFRNFAKYFRRCTRDISRFCFAQHGATAVEFALVAPVFLAMLIATLETTLFLFAQQNLQTAAVQAGRIFMTGKAQNSGTTQSQFQSTICPMVQTLFNCNNLMVNVQSYSDFASASASAPTLTYNGQGQVTNSWSYSPGTPGQVMVVQLIYQWPVVSGPLGFLLSNLPGSAIEMMGVTAFRIEPY
jgi:Flp pilus assembly protein TadG